MTTATIDRTEPIPVEFEMEQLETRYSQPRSDVACGGCAGGSGCSHTGCSGCSSCAAETTG